MKKGNLSRNIELLMEHCGIPNESQLAKKVGMAQTTINKLISGTSSDPRISTLTPIAQHFNVSIDTLLSDSPVFNHEENNNQLRWIPLLNLDEVHELYNNLSSLNKQNWPHWMPLSANSNTLSYAISLRHSKMLKPFESASVIIINKTTACRNNYYYIVKHIASNSINIKKLLIENGQHWLLALQADIPATEMNDEEWQILGEVQCQLCEMADKNFLNLE